MGSVDGAAGLGGCWRSHRVDPPNVSDLGCEADHSPGCVPVVYRLSTNRQGVSSVSRGFDYAGMEKYARAVGGPALCSARATGQSRLLRESKTLRPCLMSTSQIPTCSIFGKSAIPDWEQLTHLVIGVLQEVGPMGITRLGRSVGLTQSASAAAALVLAGQPVCAVDCS